MIIMKKVLLIISISLITMSFLPTKESHSSNIDFVENVECKIRRCNAIAKSTEKRCKRCVSNSDDYQCFQHKPKNID
jgi:hypothetical protein